MTMVMEIQMILKLLCVSEGYVENNDDCDDDDKDINPDAAELVMRLIMIVMS